MIDLAEKFFLPKLDEKVRKFFGRDVVSDEEGRALKRRVPNQRRGFDLFKFLAAAVAAAAVTPASAAPPVSSLSIDKSLKPATYQINASAIRDLGRLTSHWSALLHNMQYPDYSFGGDKTTFDAYEKIDIADSFVSFANPAAKLSASIKELLESLGLGYAAFPNYGGGIYIEAGNPKNSLTFYFEDENSAEGCMMFSTGAGQLRQVVFDRANDPILYSLINEYRKGLA